MSKYWTTIQFIIICSLATACSESEYDGSEIAGTSGRYLKVSETSLQLSSIAGSSARLEVECVNNLWQVSDLASWLSSTPQKADNNAVVTITTTEDNHSADNMRTCLFKIESAVSDWDYSIPVTATQAKAMPSVEIEPADEIAFNFEAQSQTVKVNANCDWNIVVEEASWLNCAKKSDGEITISVEENRTNVSRTGYVYVKAVNYDVSCVIRVIQSISNITSTTDNIEVGNHGGDYRLNITSETTWTATCSQSWVSLNPKSGTAGTTELQISVSPNGQNSQRTAYVFINVGDVQRIQIPIVQDRTYVRPLKSEVVLPSKGGAIEISVRANDAWNVIVPSDVSWLTFSNLSGNENGTTTLTAFDNNSANQRTTDVRFATSLGVNFDLPVVQDGRFLLVSPETTFFSKDGGESEPIEVETDGTFTFETSDEWVSCRKGAADNILFISVTQNSSNSSREGFVTLKMEGLSDGSILEAKIKVYQMGSTSSSFFINRFAGNDNDWNFYNDADINITIKGFSNTDNNWNPK